MSSVTPNSVFVVDDDPQARESVAALIRSQGLAAETYDSAEDFLARFDRSNGGCLVVDVRMTGKSGIELQEQLKQEGVELPVIFITGFGDVPTAVQAMCNGAQTFLEKPCDDHQLWNAICLALQRQDTLRGRRVQQAEIRCRLAMLTPGEHAVLEQLMDGKPNKTIAHELDLGLRTVELRRANILRKMQTSSLAGLARMVAQVREYQEFPKLSQQLVNSGTALADEGNEAMRNTP